MTAISCHFTNYSSPSTSPYTPHPHTPPRQRQYKNRVFSSPTPVPDHPRKAFLRERFKQRCFERAHQAREKKIKGRRWSASNGPSSDSFDCEMDDDLQEDHEESVLNDELFRRIMASAKHKVQHSFRLSYQLDVGSSVDPDMEDVAGWETELKGATPTEQVPDEFDDEELAAYAEECAAQEDLEAYADEMFAASDFADIEEELQNVTRVREQKAPDVDIDMAS